MLAETSTVILGAGLCGLSAAYHLQKTDSRFIVLEREARVGGLARTETYGGFSFDHSIHILYTHDLYVSDLICNQLLVGNIVKQIRRSHCYSAGVITEYPYQLNNFGLPAEIIVENLLGLLEARAATPSGAPLDFEEWIQRTFGRGIAKNFMIPYNRRQWAWDLQDMNYDWIADRVPTPEIRDVLLGALRPPANKHGPNSEFWYPREGGIEGLAQALERKIAPDRIWLQADVAAIDLPRCELQLSDGRRIRYERIISTLPLPAIVRLLGSAAPREICARAMELKHNVVHTVNVGFELTGSDNPQLMHWVYYPEESTIFHRLSFPGAFSPWMVPKNCGSVQAEISESIYRPCDRAALIQRTLDDLSRVGILHNDQRVKVTAAVTLNPAYVIYDLRHRENTRIIRDYLREEHIDSRGRFGEWEYFNMDHAILSGKAAAEALF
jgi:UDP-galactopyranose mutase